MAERYEDYDRYRERDRGREAGRRFDDYRRERGRGSLLGGREEDYDYDREERAREAQRQHGDMPYGFERGSSRSGLERSDWGREPEYRYGYSYTGGIGSQDWRTGRYGGGMSAGREEWGRGRQDWRSGGMDWDRERNRESWSEPRGMYGSEGRFTGRGPRGYRRSDERIMEDICERLTRHPEVDASEMEVRVQNGEVTLSGSVEDRHQKRIAEDIAEDASGVREVHNELRISKGLGERIGDALGFKESDDRPKTTGQPVGRTGSPESSQTHRR